LSAIDVVILTWNDGELLDAAVRSALCSNDVDVRITVVDNGSEPPATVVDDPRVSLIRNPENVGVAAGRNIGAAQGRSDLVCFLDSDARLEPDCLSKLQRVIDGQSNVALAAPVFTDQVPEASAGRGPSWMRKVARGLGLTSVYRPAKSADIGPWWEIDFAIGACQLFRRSAFEAIGGFNTDYFYGPEDIDACRRLRLLHLRSVQVADAHCDHPPRRRHRRLFTGAGLRHGLALVRYYLRVDQAHSLP
jgi:GT2 family glycosyltransferase